MDEAPKNGNNLLTVSVLTPIALATMVPLWYKFALGESEKDALLERWASQYGVPPSCLDSLRTGSPPSADCVNQALPWIIGSLTIVMVLYVIKTLCLDKPSQGVLDVIEAEFGKRHEVLKGLLEELKDGFNADDEDIELFNSKVVWEAVRALIELPNYDKKVAEEGFRWLWIVLDKELKVCLKLTQEGVNVKYSDGEKLQDIINHSFDEMVYRAYGQGFGLRGEQKKNLYKLKWEASYYLKMHGLKTVAKAGKLAMMAKEAFPWLLLQTVGTTLTAMLAPMKLFYRAQVLDNLGDTQGIEFWEAAKAMALVELLSTTLDLLTNLIKVQAETLANKEIQVAYFDGLLKLPITYWSSQKGLQGWDRLSFWKVLWFNEEVTDFLEIPQKALEDLVKALTYAYLILQTSSRSLMLLVAANFGSTVLFWILDKITSRIRALSMNGILQPTIEDYYACSYSLEEDYLTTYLSFVRGPMEIKRFEKIKTAASETDKRNNLVKVFSNPVTSMVSQGSEVAQFSTARTNVLQQGMGIADADAMVKSAENFVEQAQSIGGIFGEIIHKAKPLAKAYDIITLPRTIDPDKGLWPKEKAKGRIEFKDVRFKYPRRDVEVLKGVTFNVEPGDTIGMTGSAGCGKSTCMRLLERFYDVCAGSVLLDGVDIREYNPRWLRSQIATVAQEPKLVPLTIRENLTFGCTKEPSLEEIHDALKAANIYDSIMDKDKFPQGLRTMMESAGNVSGGEKQRIAIARAILADPPILLLDEATSALDEENQAKVQDALDKLMKGRTTMVIAHRLSTIKESTKIVAFDKGKVFEEGTHDNLLKKEGSLYRKLWERQTSKRTDLEEDEQEEQEEEDEIVPLGVEAGMNPKPSGLKRLAIVLQDIPDSDPNKKELQRAFELLEQEQSGREIRLRGIQRSAISKWQHHMSSTPQTPGKKNFQKLAKKIIFQKKHSDMSERLKSLSGETDE